MVTKKIKMVQLDLHSLAPPGPHITLPTVPICAQVAPRCNATSNSTADPVCDFSGDRAEEKHLENKIASMGAKSSKPSDNDKFQRTPSGNVYMPAMGVKSRSGHQVALVGDNLPFAPPANAEEARRRNQLAEERSSQDWGSRNGSRNGSRGASGEFQRVGSSGSSGLLPRTSASFRSNRAPMLPGDTDAQVPPMHVLRRASRDESFDI